MPVSCPVQLRSLSEEEFHELDYAVMRHVFACHNDLGRFCDEEIYQSDIALRLRSAGFNGLGTEVPFTVSFKDFSKTYYLDLAVESSVLYELKAAGALVGEHEAQLLNYLFLLGLHHGKLLNFRTASVQRRFVSTRLTPEQRRKFTVDDSRWQSVTSACERLLQVLLELMRDWGMYLQLELYQEALTWFLGGEATVVRRVGLAREGSHLGNQRVLVHGPEVAFKLSAVTVNQSQIEAHLRRFLSLTQLRALQWINFNHGVIELVTLRNGSECLAK
ncbi:MAG: GxxExxY protein [Limisphaerales bacterium]